MRRDSVPRIDGASMKTTKLLELAHVGVGFTPEEYAALQQQIQAAATEAADHAAAAASAKATKDIQSSTASVRLYIALAGIGGGLLGGYVGYRLARG